MFTVYHIDKCIQRVLRYSQRLKKYLNSVTYYTNKFIRWNCLIFNDFLLDNLRGLDWIF